VGSESGGNNRRLLVTVESRSLPDQPDVMTMPAESGAREKALVRMANVPQYAMQSIPALVGGMLRRLRHTCMDCRATYRSMILRRDLLGEKGLRSLDH
jgi:hypothetical protein